ncbi:preprotein translocase subunit SecG [Dasania sp. GY-MA-18]|uniref:Protein-export membrane protein SecG n=1 Tax=Dasania phycosphaerae TaxID=2950436 RepID=A0A9J6RH46_9GAMM|nr:MULTISPECIES: preprotein translocase subunit SecG [Dasania]MCR8921238.1 preprotein translocase subunit SecG [Dasania sp. GY-MA-18]MCZ0863666.1 preprotein translocase subunit SecG [Dasania phycosphaerae]MCZ0867394.1 preprotein translocase subunit SecG [Dasania phycosphaerae]
MEQLILIFHVLAALGIIGLILIQQGKGASMGASFGSGASQTIMGSQGGGNLLTKGTSILATLFFVTSFALAVVAKDKAMSVGIADMPVPAVVESSEAEMPVAEDSDIPAMGASDTSSDMPAAAEDIPAGN